jgi:spore coat polysaccharide biosynthesis protein SpsF
VTAGRTACVVQARTGSSRLPGKVLAEFAGRPMLQFMLERLESLRVDNLIVATSVLPTDDVVANVAASCGVAVVRGPERDVLGRFAIALREHPVERLVRLTADCPFADPELIEAVLERQEETGADYVSNTLVRTFPDGLDVEVVSSAALLAAAADAADPIEREHVTPFIYRRPERFRLRGFRGREALGDERWTVDTNEDLERLRGIAARLTAPTSAGWRDVLAVAGRADGPRADEIALVVPGENENDLDALESPLFLASDSGDEVRRCLVVDQAAEPSTRAWLVRRGGSTVGWAAVTVENGVGTLRGAVTDPTAAVATIRALEQVLLNDYQVVELVAPAGDEATLAGAGFVQGPRGLVWRR